MAASSDEPAVVSAREALAAAKRALAGLSTATPHVISVPASPIASVSPSDASDVPASVSPSDANDVHASMSPSDASGAISPDAGAAESVPSTIDVGVDVSVLNARLEGLYASVSPGRTFGQTAVKQVSPVELTALQRMRAMVPAASERQCKLHLREHEWDVVPSTLSLLNEMDDEMRTCCICKTNEIELQLVECRHACMCRSCFKELVAATKATAKRPVECPLCREEIHNTIAIKMPRKAASNERKDVERIIKACADKPERLKPAQELAKGGYSLQICILALLRNDAKTDKAEQWLRDNCIAFVSADEAKVAASVAARIAAASVATPLGLEPTPAELMALQRRYDIPEHESWEAFSARVGKRSTNHSGVPLAWTSTAAAARATPIPTIVPASARPASLSSMLQLEGLLPLLPLFVRGEIDLDAFMLMSAENLRELGITDDAIVARLLRVREQIAK
jgi:hypothetical protein